MNSLPGNPHYDRGEIFDATVCGADGSPMQVTEFLLSDMKDATLALAFEERTQALIAIAGLCTAKGKRELGQPFIEQAMERLGCRQVA